MDKNESNTIIFLKFAQKGEYASAMAEVKRKMMDINIEEKNFSKPLILKSDDNAYPGRKKPVKTPINACNIPKFKDSVLSVILLVRS